MIVPILYTYHAYDDAVRFLYLYIYIYIYVSGVAMNMYDSFHRLSVLVSRRLYAILLIVYTCIVIKKQYSIQTSLILYAYACTIQYILLLLIIIVLLYIHNVCNNWHANWMERYGVWRHHMSFIFEIIVTKVHNK